MNERASPFSLRIKRSDESDEHRLSQARTVIGRSKVGMPDLELNEVVAAPCHCFIDWDEKHEVHFLAVQGVNGVYLNKEFLRSSDDLRMLHDGDEIHIGATILVYTRIA